MKPATASLMVEMYDGINEGRVRPEGATIERGTVAFEDFAQGFAQAYKG